MKTRHVAGSILAIAAGLCGAWGQEYIVSSEAVTGRSKQIEYRYRSGIFVDRWQGVGKDFKSVTQGGLVAAMALKDAEIGLTVGGGPMELIPGSDADLMVKDAAMVSVGFFARRYLADRSSSIRPYITAHFDFLSGVWAYRDSSLLPPTYTCPYDDDYCYNDPYCDYCEEQHVNSDSLLGFGGYAGAGLLFKLSETVHLFIEGGVGAATWLNETGKGIKNDFLKDFSYVGLKVGFNFSF